MRRAWRPSEQVPNAPLLPSGILSEQRATKVTLFETQTRAPKSLLRLLLHIPPGKQLHDVHYAIGRRLRRLAQRLLAGYNRWIYESNSLGLGSCMQPPRVHKPNSIDSREGSRHHNDRDTSNGRLHQSPGTRKQRYSSKLDSKRCACVIYATFVVVPMTVQHCFTDARLPSGASARHRSGLTLYKGRDVASGGSPQIHTWHICQVRSCATAGANAAQQKPHAARMST